jgi:hypothetical protein
VAADYEESSANEETDDEEAARQWKKIKGAKGQALSAAELRKEAAAAKKEAAAKKKLEQAKRALAKAQKDVTSQAASRTRGGKSNR